MPKERVLPYIILGLIQQTADMTGQEISNQFQTEIGKFWRASHSQIYPELKRMVADQWVLQTTSPDNAKEKYYRLTPLGQEILEDWLFSPVEEPPLQKDLFSLRMFFIHEADNPRILSLLQEEKALLQEQYGHYLILQRALDRVQGQLHWIEETISDWQQQHS